MNSNPLLVAAAVMAVLITIGVLIALASSLRHRLRVLVHRAYLVGDDDELAKKPQWFIKIHNDGSEPVLITHVGWRGEGDYIAVLARRLPHMIPPGGVWETWMSEDMFGAGGMSHEEIAAHFVVRDGAGRDWPAQLNRHVPPAGYIAG